MSSSVRWEWDVVASVWGCTGTGTGWFSRGYGVPDCAWREEGTLVSFSPVILTTLLMLFDTV